MIVKCMLPFVWHKLALTSLYFNTVLLSHPVYGVNVVGAREGPGTPLQIHLSVQRSLLHNALYIALSILHTWVYKSICSHTALTTYLFENPMPA